MLAGGALCYARVMVVSLADLLDEAIAAVERAEIMRQMREAGIELPEGEDEPTPPDRCEGRPHSTGNQRRIRRDS